MKITNVNRSHAAEAGFEVVQQGKITKLCKFGEVFGEAQTGKFAQLLEDAIESLAAYNGQMSELFGDDTDEDAGDEVDSTSDDLDKMLPPNETDHVDGEEEEEADEPKPEYVPRKYRDEYKARGHVDRCGDELSNFLRNQLTTKEGTNLSLLNAIGHVNGIDVAARWGSRNIGMQRMNLGNALRQKLKKEGAINWPTFEGGIEIKTAAFFDIAVAAPIAA